jgi:hypothetical protein
MSNKLKPKVLESKVVFDNWLRIHQDTLSFPPDYKITKKYFKIEDEDKNSVMVIGKTINVN